MAQAKVYEARSLRGVDASRHGKRSGDLVGGGSSDTAEEGAATGNGALLFKRGGDVESS